MLNISAFILATILLAYPSVGQAPNNIKALVMPKARVVQGQMFTVTAYTAKDKGMNGKGITASGLRAKRWHTAAASRGIPMGTRIYFPALGRTFVVQDRGGAIKGSKIDLYVGSRKEALKFGKRKLEGVILP